MGNYPRPVIEYGPTPDGLHRYLYGQADQGTLYLWTEMAAMEYGLSHRRFLSLLHQLIDVHKVAEMRPGSHARIKPYWVSSPASYNPEIDERRQLSDEEKSVAIELLEQLQDDIADEEDEADDDAS